jgi:hypothetical protein
MNAVVKLEEEIMPSGAVMVTQTSAFLQMIERASRDPAVDIVKFRELMLMKREVEMQAAEREFDNCMADAQSEMRPVVRDANNPQTRSRYASYFALDTALRPIYTKHGFSLSFYSGDGAPEGHLRVCCKVAHRGGHTERPHIDMPADGKGAKGGDVMTKTHATGSAAMYGRRYLLSMIFNIATTDDDGNAADSSPVSVSDEQASQITALALEVKADIAKMLNHFKAESISDIRAAKFAEVIGMLNAKKAARAKEPQP